MWMAMIAAALVAQTAWDDRAQFEKSWAGAPETHSQIRKEQAWRIWVWTDAQFVAGYCADHIPASTAAAVLSLPDEPELMATEHGRKLLASARANFREGMSFRKDVPPTPESCEAQIENSIRLLQSTKLTD